MKDEKEEGGMSWISKLPGISKSKKNRDYPSAESIKATLSGVSVNSLSKKDLQKVKRTMKNMEEPYMEKGEYIVWGSEQDKVFVEILRIRPDPPVFINEDTKIEIVDRLYYDEEEETFDVESERLVEVKSLPDSAEDATEVESPRDFENVLNRTGMSSTVYHCSSENTWVCVGKKITLD